MALHFDFHDLDDSLKDDFDDSLLDERDETDEDDIDEPVDEIDDIDDSEGKELVDISEEEDLGTDKDIPPLLVLENSRALLAKGDEGLKVGPDLLPERVLVGYGRHAVGLVTLATVSAGRALPPLPLPPLGTDGGEGLGTGPDITWILHPLRVES